MIFKKCNEIIIIIIIILLNIFHSCMLKC